MPLETPFLPNLSYFDNSSRYNRPSEQQCCIKTVTLWLFTSFEREREMATMTKKSITKIFLHEHTLELNDKMEEYKFKCCVCNQGISDWHHYRCSMCSKTRIHEYPCSEIPLQIDHHPLHPHHSSFFASSSKFHSNLCDFCGKNCKGAFMYKCIDCPFVLDVKCALLSATATKKIQFRKQQQQQQQPNHSHPLILCDMVKSFDYTCCCCGLTIDGDCVYVCLQCKGLFHNSCAELPLEIKHPFHSSHPLVLSQPLKNQFFYCGVCHQELHRLNYLCSKCRFVLDVDCAPLKPEQGQIQQFRHPHPLIFCNNKENFPSTCYACDLPLADSIYFCPECPALLHKSCADLPPEIEHLLHPHHTLTLNYCWRTGHTVGPYCNACLGTCHGFFYKCCCCEWYMDVRCACLPKSTILRWSKIHYHPLALIFRTENVCWRCNICDKYINTPFFRCLLCRFELHVHCISRLPPTLKYHNHVHSLTFTNCPIKDRPDEDANAEFYCDACEKRRDLAQPTYYCKVGCQFVAHPHCVVSEIIQILEEEWWKHEKVEESLALTLTEFLDSFTKDENEEVQGLFKAYIWDVRDKSSTFPKILGFGDSYAHLDKVSTWILRKYVSRVEIAMPWGKWDTTSKVIKDGHFMILENHISILKALFSKYTNFNIESRLSTKATMLFVMTICEAIHSMCNTKVMDITTSLLLTWFNYFAFAQYAGSKILFVTDHLTKLVRAHFGFQVGHDVLVDLSLAECNVQITKQHTGIDSIDISIIEEDEESVDSEELAIIEENKEIVDSEELTIIEEDEEILDSEELAIIEDKETHYLWEKVDSMQLTIIKLDEAIKELGKKKQALLKKRKRWCIRKECLIDALELEGQMAGTRLL
ncbi:hypothetical protein LOK49_LG10G03009 [Camellia lanceoleosa]|uniref:Uncharacterized protein n=1 Tax=Camellia lanceoleosa TaxID=1840588 RepID=A0ACC0G9M6_9ERIC|nr:hypothetical protein LOK49_LG10G03009 [Camellia lanceoleosa]